VFPRAEEGQPRDIAARPREAGHEPARNGIANRTEDYGNGPGRFRGRDGAICADGDDDIDLECNQFGRESGESLRPPLGIAGLDQEVALYIAAIT
jgi:hypothetical protein